MKMLFFYVWRVNKGVPRYYQMIPGLMQFINPDPF
jgi:hypothetical protein